MFFKKIILPFFLLVTSLSYTQENPKFQDESINNIFYSLVELTETNPKRFFTVIDSVASSVSKKDSELFQIYKHYLTGSVYRNLENFEKAIYNYEETKKLAKKYNYLWFIPEVYREMGDEYMDQDMWKKAVKSYDNAISWYKKFGNELGVITCTYDGFIEHEQEKYEESNRILKKLLPVLQKSNPVYLDALSTIADNYISLDNVDSAFAYVNKMPLDTIEDVNNFNYSMHKHFVYVEYYIDKKDAKKANFYNEIIGKNRYATDIDGQYFNNKIEIAKLTNDIKGFQQYSDSLETSYQKRVKELQKKDVYTAEKVINTENKLTDITKKAGRLRMYIGLILLIVVSTAIPLYIRSKKKKETYEKMLVDLKNEIEHLLVIQAKNNETNLESLEQKVIVEANKFNLTDRETDVLLYVAKGLKNKQIADQLFVSVNTIKYHTRNIYEKMDVKNRSEITSKLLLKS